MNICLLLFLLISGIPTISIATEIKEAAAIEALVQQDLPPIRNLLIFMDTSETEWSAVSYDLIAALEQKAAPIIVSRHLLHGIFKQLTIEQHVADAQRKAEQNPDNKQLQIVAQNYAQFLDFFNEIQKKIAAALEKYKKDNDVKTLLAAINQHASLHPYWNDTQHERIRSLLHFNPDEWFIEFTSGFYILVPKTYASSISPLSSSITGELTTQQLSLGLKLGRSGTGLLPARAFKQAITGSFAAGSENDFVKLLCGDQECSSPLFITRSDYTKHGITPEKMPRWIIYVFGHGMLGGNVAGFDIRQFQELLDFCNTKIVTHLFMYKTCYGASSHTARLFLDRERADKRIKNYSFPIMCGAIPDIVTYGAWPTMGIPGKLTLEDLDLEHGTLRLHTFPHFKQSFALAAQEVIPYKAVAPTLVQKESMLKNLMLVKPAYLEWSSLIDADALTVSITKNMALTRTKPLAISTLVKKGTSAPQAILLYSHHVPFEISIDTTPLPTLISMIPGKCFHVIDKIRVPATTFGFINTIKTFLPDAPKILWIKEVQGTVSPDPTENVIIDIINKENYTLYTTRAGEYRKRQIIDGIKKPDDVSEDPAGNYVPPYANLLRMNRAFQQEDEERKQIQAIAQIQERKRVEAKEREAKKGKE